MRKTRTRETERTLFGRGCFGDRLWFESLRIGWKFENKVLQASKEGWGVGGRGGGGRGEGGGAGLSFFGMRVPLRL